MHLLCPECGQAMAAKCGRCGAVFGFGDRIGESQGIAGAKARVEMPGGFQVSRDGSGLLLVRRWFSWRILALLFFCVFWDGFLLVWYYLAFVKGAPLVMKLIPLLHVAIGVSLTYTVIAWFANRTFIRVGRTEVSVRHSPCPWPGNCVVSTRDVDQVFCEERYSRSRRSSSHTYDVSLILKGGRRVKLVANLDSPDQAAYIEQEVETYLGIKDRAVAGEMRPI